MTDKTIGRKTTGLWGFLAYEQPKNILFLSKVSSVINIRIPTWEQKWLLTLSPSNLLRYYNEVPRPAKWGGLGGTPNLCHHRKRTNMTTNRQSIAIVPCPKFLDLPPSLWTIQPQIGSTWWFSVTIIINKFATVRTCSPGMYC